MKKRIQDRLAVCSWSLQPATPTELVERMQEIGLSKIQCALDPIRSLPEIWVNLAQRLSEAKIQIVSGMFGCVGEDYSSLESIRETGGIVPDSTWDENFENIQAVAEIAKKLRMKLVTFHAGFLPHDSSDPGYATILHRLRLIAGIFAAKRIDLALETGQETAETLSRFLTDLSRPNVGVNFDPANMILYGKGDPIESLRTLGPWLRQIHLKDAIQTQVSGTWGEEVPVGTGDVDWRGFLRALADLDFKGPLCFEREAGDQRVKDIRVGRDFVKAMEKTEQVLKPPPTKPLSIPPLEPAAETEPAPVAETPSISTHETTFTPPSDPPSAPLGGSEFEPSTTPPDDGGFRPMVFPSAQPPSQPISNPPPDDPSSPSSDQPDPNNP